MHFVEQISSSGVFGHAAWLDIAAAFNALHVKQTAGLASAIRLMTFKSSAQLEQTVLKDYLVVLTALEFVIHLNIWGPISAPNLHQRSNCLR